MAAACVINPADETTEIDGAVPVKNTFIHFGASRAKRSLRLCVTDPEDPKLWQPRTEPKEPAPVIAEEGTTTEPEESRSCSEEAKSPPSSPVVDCPQIQTPEVSPRNVAPTPWQPAMSPFGSPPAAHGLHSAAAACTPPVSTPQATAVPNAAARWTPTSTPNAQVLGLIGSAAMATSCSSSLASPSSAPPAGAQVLATDGSNSFKFTLRLADDVGLGVDLATDAAGGLFVQNILPNGAIDSWNRRCLDGSASAGKVVNTGDALVCVNGKTNSQSILGECRGKLLLTMTFSRKGGLEESGSRVPSAANSVTHSPAGVHGSPAGPSPSAHHHFGHGGLVRSPAGGRTPGKENKVFLQIHAALEGERLHASKNLLR